MICDPSKTPGLHCKDDPLFAMRQSTGHLACASLIAVLFRSLPRVNAFRFAMGRDYIERGAAYDPADATIDETFATVMFAAQACGIKTGEILFFGDEYGRLQYAAVSLLDPQILVDLRESLDCLHTLEVSIRCQGRPPAPLADPDETRYSF